MGMLQHLPEVPDFDNYDNCLQWFRSLSTDILKCMWDDDDYHQHCDEIHWAMNERGEGGYVTV